MRTPFVRTAARLLGTLAVTLGVGLGTAEATLIISSSIDGGPTVFAIDNQAISTCGSPVAGPCQLPDTDPTLGSLALNPFLTGGGDVSVQASLQTADVATVPGTVNRLDSTGTQVTNVGAVSHSFAVAIGATDFQGPVSQATTTGAGQWSHLGDGFGDTAISMQWWNDPNNAQGGLNPLGVQPGILIDTFAALPSAANPNSFSHTGGPFAVADPGLFSMSLQFTGTLAPGVRLTGRELTEIKPLVAVPQPASVLLLGGGLLLTVGLLRTRRTEGDA